MIETITLKNFRTHKESILELNEGLNVIKGDNEAGKTNILRGLDWVINNRPSGDDMCSYWGGDTAVGVIVDGKYVQRHRLANGQNLYTITHEDGSEEEFRAFGKGVPAWVQELLNITSVNMHSQMDGPFLLNQSPADVARYFNSIVNLDVIDRSIKSINKILSKDKSDLSYAKQEKKLKKKSITEYDWLEKAEGCVVKLEATRSQLQALDRDIVSLTSLISAAVTLEEELLSLYEIANHEGAVSSLIAELAWIDTLVKSQHNLNNLIAQSQRLESEKAKHQETLVFEGELDVLIEMKDEIYNGDDEVLELQKLMNRQMQLQVRLEDYTITLQDLETEWHKLMPDTCPLCGK